MKFYRRQKVLLAGFLCFSLAVGIVSELAPRHELFPFYSWFLFILVPQKTIAYDILILEQPGSGPSAPRSYQQADDLVLAPRNIVTYRLVQALGRAVEKHDDAAEGRLRHEWELHLRTSPVRYELVKLRYDDPLTRWKTGRPQRSESIGVFVFESPPKKATP